MFRTISTLVAVILLRLSGDISCSDVNECQQTTRQLCDQICKDDPISYHCECRPGFKLNPRDNRSCDGELTTVVDPTVCLRLV